MLPVTVVTFRLKKLYPSRNVTLFYIYRFNTYYEAKINGKISLICKLQYYLTLFRADYIQLPHKFT